MKKYLILFLLIMLAGTAMSEGNGKIFFPYDYHLYQLENGLKAFLIPVEGSGLVAYYSVVRTGSRDEWEKGKSGFAHFFEHMMFRGTENFPGPVYDSLITSIGADANAYTTDDLTAFHLVFPSDYMERVIQLESDRFQNLSYSEADFKTESGAVYGEYRKGRVNPYSVLLEVLQNTAFDVHTYKHTTIGFEKDIQNMPNMYAYSKSFFKRYYRPENVILVIAGDFDVQQTKKFIKQYYQDWKPGYVPPRITPEPEQQGERVKNVKYPGKTLPILWVAYKGDAFDPANKLVAAGDLLGDLAFGENSDIYKKLVIREQKVQFINSWYPYNRDPKLFSIYTMVKNEEDIPYVQNEIDKTIEKFKNEVPEPQKVDDLKNRVRYSYLMNLDTPENIAGGLARIVALTGEVETVNIFFENIQSLTPEDVREAARHYFLKKHRTIVTLKGEK